MASSDGHRIVDNVASNLDVWTKSHASAALERVGVPVSGAATYTVPMIRVQNECDIHSRFEYRAWSSWLPGLPGDHFQSVVVLSDHTLPPSGTLYNSLEFVHVSSSKLTKLAAITWSIHQQLVRAWIRNWVCTTESYGRLESFDEWAPLGHTESNSQ